MDSRRNEPSGNRPYGGAAWGAGEIQAIAGMLPVEWLMRPQRPIEELLGWAYRVERVDVMTKWEAATLGGRILGGHYPADSLLRLERPSGGAGGMVPMPASATEEYHRPHAAARLLHDQVLGLPDVLIGLIVRHAQAGTRPETYAGWRLAAGPKRSRKGKPQKLYDAQRNPIGTLVRFGGIKPGAPQIVEWANVEAARRIYTGWWQAVAEVTRRFNAASTVLSATHAAAEFPWRP